MIRSLLKHELKLMSKNKKNIILVFILLALLLSYCFIILPNKKNIDSFDIEATKIDLEDIADIQKWKEEKRSTGLALLIGVPIYANNDFYYRFHTNMVTAIKEQNFYRFHYLHTHYLEWAGRDYITDESMFSNSPFPGKDRMHLYFQKLLRDQGYLSEELPITYELIEQKTALQTLQNLLMGITTYIIIFCAIYFSSDVLLRDKQYRTVLQGFPLSWYRILNIKTLVAFLYTIIVLSVLLIIGMIILSLQNGFGFFSIQIPVTFRQNYFTLKDYDTISMSLFLIKSLSFIPILIYLFIRLNMVLSLLLRNEYLVLLCSTILLFSERIYFSRRLREIVGVEISNFPQTYFEFGKVVTGEKNFLVNLETITYSKGIAVLLIGILVIEILLIASSRVINKQRFY